MVGNLFKILFSLPYLRSVFPSVRFAKIGMIYSKKNKKKYAFLLPSYFWGKKNLQKGMLTTAVSCKDRPLNCF